VITIATQITAIAQSGFSKTRQGHHEGCQSKMPEGGEDMAMSTSTTSRNTPNPMELAFVRAGSTTSDPRSTHLPNPPPRHRSFAGSTQNPLAPPNEVAELLADIDGVPVLVRFLVTDISANAQSDFVSKDVDLRLLLSTTLQKMVDRMGGSSLRRDFPSKQPLATVELISSVEHLVRLPDLSNETVLRVGPLELDLLNRIAKRDGRRIDLRPREFHLLKYMMQRSDELLTRETLLKEVWNYRFVPKTNLVDVHMGRLRRKIDGPNGPFLIRNVRGIGFVLSATPFSHCSPSRSAAASAAWPSNNSSPANLTLM
jgi:DNA-binding winged helix-turn-helix (wHTH) protein